MIRSASDRPRLLTVQHEADDDRAAWKSPTTIFEGEDEDEDEDEEDMAVIALAQRDYLDETEGEANENRRAAAARTTLRAQLERGLQVKKFGRSGNARPKLLYLAPSTDATRGARLVWRNMPMSPSKRHPVAPTGRDANRKAVPLVGARVVRAAVPRSDGSPTPAGDMRRCFSIVPARATSPQRRQGQTDASRKHPLVLEVDTENERDALAHAFDQLIRHQGLAAQHRASRRFTAR